MTEKKPILRRGFTLVELMISMTIMIIVSLAIGAVVVDGQNGWSTMYDKIHSDIFTDSYVVRKKFDSLMRRASGEKIFIENQNQSVEVYYYSDGSTTIDRYMRFYKSNDKMLLEYGTLSPESVINREIVCGNVSKCTFHQAGRAVQLILELDNGTQKNTVVTSAIAHN